MEIDSVVFPSKEIVERKAVTENPLVSIITPVFNGIKYLENCIQNVLSQSYPHIEHIFIDGGSDDGTLDMLNSYKNKYPDRIRLISEPDNGVGEAINKGLKMAKGEIFGWLDADSMFEPDAIITVVDFFRANPGAYFMFGESNIIDEAGKVVGKYLTQDFNLKEAIRDRCYIHVQSAFYRREVIDSVGPFNDLGNCHEFWIRVGAVFPMYRINKALSRNRLDKDGIFFSKEAGKRKVLRARLREDYEFCRQYGGSILSPRCHRYFLFLVLDRLGLYSFIASTVLSRRYRYPCLDKALRFLGF